MIKRNVIMLIFIGSLFIISACGGGANSGGAPHDSTLSINPAEVAITDGSAGDVHTQDFFITVTDTATGVPLKNVELRISFVWASPDGQFDTLYYDLYPCGDGINETPLAQLTDGGTPANSPMYVKTDENGSYVLRFQFLSGLIDTTGDCVQDTAVEWSADVQVTSGSKYASADFSVKAPTAP